MEIRVMIVDDEEPARCELTHLLQEMPGLSVVGEAATGQEALKLALILKPDVVFLDIQMPMGGLEVARELNRQKKPPHIIFVTAYDHYALDAFEFHGVDYLLKPVNEERLLRTIAWVQDNLRENGQCPVLQRIPAEKKGHFVMLDLKDILFFFSRDDRVMVRTLHEELLTPFLMKDLEERLNNGFFRCHRKYIVNLSHIEEVIPWFNGSYNLKVNDQDKTEVPVSRQKTQELRKILGLTK